MLWLEFGLFVLYKYSSSFKGASVDHEDESFDEFLNRISQNYTDDFEMLDDQIEQDSDVWIYDQPSDYYSKIVVRSSAMTAFLVVLSFVGIHWLCQSADKSIGKITSYEVIALVGLIFFNLGIYSFAIYDRLNLLLIRIVNRFRINAIKRRYRRINAKMSRRR